MTPPAAETPEAFFVRDGERYVPTGIGASPWNPKAQGGAPLSGLTTQLLDELPCPVPMIASRLTIDILGVVPMTALEPTIRMVRDGQRIQLAEIELRAEGRTWVRATMLRVRTDGPGRMTIPLARPFPGDEIEAERGRLSEMIRLEGDARQPGPGAMWVRIFRPMVEGTPLTPLTRVAVAADFGATVSPPASPDAWTFANLDVSVHLSRLPESEWLLLDAVSEAAENGTAIAHMKIGDRHGMIGTAHLSLYLDRR